MLPDGRTARFPALGRVSGDWGGGGGLAEEALWHAARAEDGRGEPTELARALPEHFGLGSMYALIEALHLGHVPAGRRHELTPVLFTVAEAGDPVASGLVDRLADEVANMATVALGQLGLLDSPAPVVLGGSILAARRPGLDAGVRGSWADGRHWRRCGWWRLRLCWGRCCWGWTRWGRGWGLMSGCGGGSGVRPYWRPGTSFPGSGEGCSATGPRGRSREQSADGRGAAGVRRGCVVGAGAAVAAAAPETPGPAGETGHVPEPPHQPGLPSRLRAQARTVPGGCGWWRGC